MAEDNDLLTDAELLVLAAAVREVMRADGAISDGEARMAAEMAPRLGLTEDAWESIWQQAARKLPNPEAVMEAAARDVRRTETRELVYELLHRIATDGSIVDSEWDLLEWLDETWRLVDASKGDTSRSS